MRIHVILDPTALHTYAVLRKHEIPVDELLRSVAGNKGWVGVPALALVEVSEGLLDDERRNLIELFDRVAVATLPLLADQVHELIKRADSRTAGAAHALALALGHGALLATYEPGMYADDIDPDYLLDLSE